MTVTIIRTIDELRRRLDQARRGSQTVGFVPTMGYLHDGHGSLMRAAAADTDTVVASVFVNPLQFAPTEDLTTYPRDLERDVAVAGANGVELVFAPADDEMYPEGRVLTTVDVGGVSARLEGESRPSHFAGVATVVSKLLNIVGPCRAYFGEKDFQQLAVIRRLVFDLSIPAEIVGCPIVREPDGLAMSSRNVRLDPDDRAAAVVLSRALAAGADAIGAGATDPASVAATMAGVVAGEPRARLDYAAVADPATLETPSEIRSDVRLLIAARLGPVRLIDNRGVTVTPPSP
ncbi:MAG: pantoate--beta-alanine ligase [Acidimicrobiales bacterium]